MRHWRSQAQRIPDRLLRVDALAALDRKRCNIEGAAFFWTLARRRDHQLLRVLVAYEVLADYLDCVSERGAHDGIANGLQLHLALVDALSPGGPIHDYYRLQEHKDDGGYVYALVGACRRACSQLARFEFVKPPVLHVAGLTQVLAINHHPEPSRRDEELERWVSSQLPAPSELEWFERTAGASAWLTVFALLALGSEPRCTQRQAAMIYRAYFPWISLLGTMLDSYSDMEEDAKHLDHSYIAHYPNLDVACERLAQLIRRALTEAGLLPGGARHRVLVACMVAMYLSKASVHTPALKSRTEQLLYAGGPLVGALLPILRIFRAGYRQTRC